MVGIAQNFQSPYSVVGVFECAPPKVSHNRSVRLKNVRHGLPASIAVHDDGGKAPVVVEVDDVELGDSLPNCGDHRDWEKQSFVSEAIAHVCKVPDRDSLWATHVHPSRDSRSSVLQVCGKHRHFMASA